MQSDFSQPQELTSQLQEKAQKVKTQVESKLNKKFHKFLVVKCLKSPDVGIIYKMKVETDDDYLHIIIHEALPDEGSHISLNNIESGKKIEDDL